MSTIDDKKNGRKPIVYGDVKSFLKETVTNIVYVVLWGIGGAFLFTLVKSVDTTYHGHSMVDIILPTDLDQPPYKIPKMKPMNLDEVIHSEGVDKIRAILEWIYPMNHPSFPYNLDNTDKPDMHSISALWNGFLQWLVHSCSFTFSTYRSVYKTMLATLYFILDCDETIGGMFIFFVCPFFILYFSLIPSIIPIGVLLSCLGAVVGKNYEEGLYWVFAPITVFIYGIFGVIKSPANFFNFTFILSMVTLFYISFCITPIALIWYILLSIALWIYAIFFFICSPLVQEGGLQRIKEAIGLHWKGLTIIFLGLVTKSAFVHLSSNLFSGVTVGCILSLFLLYRA